MPPLARPRSARTLARLLLLASACVLALALAPRAEAQEELEQDVQKLEWWKRTNFYHIYIRSFKDSDGNGQGDLRGITSQLDYLKGLGVETLLLSPFYSSPMRDIGYDIDNYTAINPLFGTMHDFEQLVAELKRRAMRLVVDFVPNHSSNQHAWFKCSERALTEAACAKYKDYYVWSNSTRFEGRFPTNWVNLFDGKSAWTWSPVRGEFYLHQFLAEQPDLNLRNELVRQEFKDIARFWLAKGVDGLRVDAVLHFLEDTIKWRDEPQDPMWQPGWDPYDRLLHIYTRSLSESAGVVRDWHEVAREFAGDRVIITEAYDAIPKLIEYYGPKPSERYADMPFNFELFKLNRANFEPALVERVITSWLNATEALDWPSERGARSPWSCWVTGNHDNKRIVNRVGNHNAALYKWLAHLVPGVPVSYYGDELDMHDANFSLIPQRTLDEGEPSRLVFRAPMAWSADEPAGNFSSTRDTWMPMNENWRENNVQTMLQSADRHTPLKKFRQLLELRREHLATLAFGELHFYANRPAAESRLFAMARTSTRSANLLLLANLDAHKSETVRLAGALPSQLGALSSADSRLLAHLRLPKSAQLLMLNYEHASNAHSLVEGSSVALDGLELAPSQAIVVRY